MKSFALTLAFGALAVTSHAVIVIDDFADAQELTATTSNPMVGDRVTGSMIGGSRGTFLELTQSNFNLKSQIVIGGGAFGSNDIGNASNVYLGYFSTGLLGNGWSYSVDTNYDLSLATEYQFNFLMNDSPLQIYIFQISEQSVRTYSKFIGAGGTRTETVGVDDLVSSGAAFDPSKVDFMYIGFGVPTNGDFALTSIEAVPEPGTLAGIGLGLAALARKRRK